MGRDGVGACPREYAFSGPSAVAKRWKGRTGSAVMRPTSLPARRAGREPGPPSLRRQRTTTARAMTGNNDWAAWLATSTKVAWPFKRFTPKRKRVVLLVGEANGFMPRGVAESIGEALGVSYEVILLHVGDRRKFDFRPGLPKAVLNVAPSFAASTFFPPFLYQLCRAYRPDCVVAVHGSRLSFLKYFEWVGITVAAFYAGLGTGSETNGDAFDVLLNASVVVLAEGYRVRFDEVACEVIAGRECILVGDDVLRSVAEPGIAEATAGTRQDASRLVQHLTDRFERVAALRRQEKEGERIIAASGCFDKALALGSPGRKQGQRGALQAYLRVSRLVAPRKRPGTGKLLRRSMTGFHPLVYASECDAYDDGGLDPLAHFIAAGRPAGGWTHRVIQLDSGSAPAPSRSTVAIHGHFHYDELFPEFLLRLAVNRTRVDLFLTTGDAEKATRLQAACAQAGIARFEVKVVPNKGRDIGAFLCAFNEADWRRYDVVGHFHGKRSLHRDASFGAGWRDYLWDHLVGSSTPVLDRIIYAFDLEPELGLVFPEDPFLPDWDANRRNAENLARAMGITRELPVHFNFPIGNMFWLRPRVLSVLYRLKLSWSDMPPEPLPVDGTILHAIERLLPFAAAEVGLGYATTYDRRHIRD